MSCDPVAEFPASERLLSDVITMLQDAGMSAQRLACGGGFAISVTGEELLQLRRHSAGIILSGDDSTLLGADVFIFSGAPDQDVLRNLRAAASKPTIIAVDSSVTVSSAEVRGSGGVSFSTTSGVHTFTLYSTQAATDEGTTPPDPRRIPESARNLKQRAEWFKRRSGQ